MEKKPILSVLYTIYHNIERWICIACFAVILVFLFFQTMGRYIFSTSASWPEEISCYLLIWLVFFSASFAMDRNAHIRVDAVMMLYPKAIRKYIDLITLVIWLVASVLLVIFGWEYTVSQFKFGATAISLRWWRMWWVYIAIPVGHAFLCLRIIEKIVILVRTLIRGEAVVDSSDSSEVGELIAEMSEMAAADLKNSEKGDETL